VIETPKGSRNQAMALIEEGAALFARRQKKKAA
jgi:hypothetical protein